MPRLSSHHKDVSFNFRVDLDLKTAFQEITEADDISAAQVLREFMRGYILKRKQRDFTSEARRQSAIISAASGDPNADEARIMSELENDLQYFSTGLKKPSQIMIDKAVTVPRDKIGMQIGAVDRDILSDVDRALSVFLGLYIG